MQQPTIKFEDPAAAARAWANEYEARLAAEKERDRAKYERGQISSRREATALARLVLSNREVAKLKGETVRPSEYATVEQVSKATNWQYEWHPLRRWCNKNKQPPVMVNGVYAWPASAWKAVFGVDLESIAKLN